VSLELLVESYDVLGLEVLLRHNFNFSLQSFLESKFGARNVQKTTSAREYQVEIEVIDDKEREEPLFKVSNSKLICTGAFKSYMQRYGSAHSVFRYVIYNFLLSELEKRNLFGLHASAIYNEESEKVLLILGPRGAGKTSFAIAGINMGWKLIGDDLVPVCPSSEGLKIFTGPTEATIKHMSAVFFKEFLIKNNLISEDKILNGGWHEIDVELNQFLINGNSLKNKDYYIVFPRIEISDRAHLRKIKADRKVITKVYEDITSKVRCISMMNYVFPVPSFDTSDLMRKRIDFVRKLFAGSKENYFVFGNPINTFKKLTEVI